MTILMVLWLAALTCWRLYDLVTETMAETARMTQEENRKQARGEARQALLEKLQQPTGKPGRDALRARLVARMNRERLN